MARIVSRRPFVGIVSGFLFGALGLLLIDLDRAAAGVTFLAPLLLTVAGYFFLFVAIMAFLAAALSLLRGLRRR